MQHATHIPRLFQFPPITKRLTSNALFILFISNIHWHYARMHNRNLGNVMFLYIATNCFAFVFNLSYYFMEMDMNSDYAGLIS